MTTLESSYGHCTAVARARAKNFYWSFVLLPRHKRRAMCAVYAFMRECDDLSDGPRASAEAMAAWRADLDRTLNGAPAAHPLWPALLDAVERFRIPHRYLHEMIDGVQSDLTAHVFETFDELYRYCYLVASVVGLTIIHIFEFEDPSAPALAEKCGIAFQLTNIIRDAGEDQAMGRVYFPQDDLRRFGVTRLDQDTPELRRLLTHYGARARASYDEARPLAGMMHRDSRASLWALIEIYSRLLKRIDESGYDVLSRRIRLSNWEKARILFESRFRA